MSIYLILIMRKFSSNTHYTALFALIGAQECRKSVILMIRYQNLMMVNVRSFIFKYFLHKTEFPRLSLIWFSKSSIARYNLRSESEDLELNYPAASAPVCGVVQLIFQCEICWSSALCLPSIGKIKIVLQWRDWSCSSPRGFQLQENSIKSNVNFEIAANEKEENRPASKVSSFSRLKQISQLCSKRMEPAKVSFSFHFSVWPILWL